MFCCEGPIPKGKDMLITSLMSSGVLEALKDLEG